jgi:hypothetical protein
MGQATVVRAMPAILRVVVAIPGSAGFHPPAAVGPAMTPIVAPEAALKPAAQDFAMVSRPTVGRARVLMAVIAALSGTALAIHAPTDTA